MSKDYRTVTLYYDNKQVKSIERISGKYLSCPDGPAFEEWTRDGQKIKEVWFINGAYNRIGGPSYIVWSKDGRKVSEDWVVNDKYHRIDGPAIIDYDNEGKVKSFLWYINGDIIDTSEHSDIDFENWPLSVEDQIKLKLRHG